MPDIPAKDVKALRDATGAGMLDAKRALEATGNDFDAAVQYLRERGLGKAAERAGRENINGAVAAAVTADGSAAALVQLKSETDFVAKSPQFVGLAQDLATLVAERGEPAVEQKKDALDDLKVTLKENVELGRVVRFEAGSGNVLDTYLHIQNERGINGVLVELADGSPDRNVPDRNVPDRNVKDLAHDIAVHIAFGRPNFLTRDDVPVEEVEAERATLEAETRNEGKPEQALPKIVEGKLNGWFKRVPGGVLVEQPYARDDKQTLSQVLGQAKVVRFA